MIDKDPNGLDQHQSGAKLDAGKIRPGLVLGGFSKPLIEVSKVGTFGANKYTDDGWKDVVGGKERYTDAMFRHYMQEQSGETYDPETCLLHAAHLAWNALARLHFILQEQQDVGRVQVPTNKSVEHANQTKNEDLSTTGTYEGSCKILS